jgi:hypothetical protein
MQSLWAVGLVHDEALSAQEMQLAAQLLPQLCSIDLHPVMQPEPPLPPRHPLRQCW